MPGGSLLLDRVRTAMKKTQSQYLSEQHEDGYWWYELESNVSITAEYLMLLYFLGQRDETKFRKIATHILKNQRPDGAWAIYWDGPGDLSATCEAYFALKLAGFREDDKELQKAREFILASGGVEKSRVFTRIFLALFGEFDWRSIPSIPVEMNLLPAWAPFNIYCFSSWARSTVVPLSVIVNLKPSKSLPESARIGELYLKPDSLPSLAPRGNGKFSWKSIFLFLDGLFKKLEKFPLTRIRQKGFKKAEDWILSHQEKTGDWGGIQPAMLNSILALSALGYTSSDEPIVKGLRALEKFTIEKEDEIVLQSCISPVWDTALTSISLVNSGFEAEHHSLQKAAKWIASKQIFRTGDWNVKRPLLKPGGWAFEFDNSWYPDVDDTAVVLMLLRRYGEQIIKKEHFQRGLDWVLGMQGKDGGWGAFDTDNNMKILNCLPFGDLEAMIDPSTPDLTGRVLELLGLLGYKTSNPVVQKGIKFLRKEQEDDGSWWGRWGVNYVYGTSAVLVGLSAVGEDLRSPYIRKAVHWLKSKQKFGGGWGECCESYVHQNFKAHRLAIPSQTAWAILGLMAAGEKFSESVIRGIRFLLKKQRPDGFWDEDAFTGTGFPKYFMLKYHNYRNCFPLMALGKFTSSIKEIRG